MQIRENASGKMRRDEAGHKAVSVKQEKCGTKRGNLRQDEIGRNAHGQVWRKCMKAGPGAGLQA